ncbi:MAG: hypothetical protein AAB288_14870 [Acidobacteriota bacterium]
MAKTFLYRFFGIGKMPAALVADFQREGLVLMDEGIRGTVTYHNFRGGGRYSNWKRQWYSSSIILTAKRLIGYRLRHPIIDVELTDPRFKQLNISADENETLLIDFDASLFQPDWSGRIEYRFKTPLAQQFLNEIRSRS